MARARITTTPTVQPQGPQSPQVSVGQIQGAQNAAPGQVQQLGRSMTALSAQALRHADVLQDQLNNAKTKQGLSFANDAIVEELRDPETGYLNTTGLDAVGERRARTMAALEKRFREIESSLDNDVQRDMFRTNAARLLTAAKEQVLIHEAKQVSVFDAAQDKVLLGQELESAVSASLFGSPTPAQDVPGGTEGPGIPAQSGAIVAAQTDPAFAAARRDTASFHLANAESITHQILDRQGVPNDSKLRDAAIKDLRGQFHGRVIEGLIAQERHREARGYMAEHGESMTAETRTKAQGLLTRASKNDEALRLARTAMQVHDGKVLARMAREEGRRVYQHELIGGEFESAAVSAIMSDFDAGKIDADVAESAVAQVRAEHQRRRQRFNDTAADALLRAERWLTDPANQFSSVNSPDFPEELRDQLEDYGVLDDAVRVASGRDVTDPQALVEITELFESGAFSKAEWTPSRLLREFYGRLSSSDFATAQKYLAAAKKPAEEPDAEVARDEQIKEMARRVGILSRGTSPTASRTGAGTTNSAAFAEFRRDAIKMLRTWTAVHKKEPTFEEREKIFQWALQENMVMVDGEQVPAIAVTGDDDLEAYVEFGNARFLTSRVPPEIRERITAKLHTMGRDLISEREIVQIYLKGLRDKVNRQNRRIAPKGTK